MQLNGLDERFNQTLQSMLVKAAKDLKHIWDEFIDAAVFAYNTSCHESTHHTPFEIMFGRKALLPVEVAQFSSHQTVSFSIVLCTCNFILSYLFRSADLGNPNICLELLLSTRQNLLS